MNRYYALRDGQFLRVTETPIATPTDLVATLSRDAWSKAFLMGHINVAHPTDAPTSSPAYSRVRPDGTVSIFTKLPFLILTADWALDRGVFTLQPRGYGNGTPVRQAPVWVPNRTLSVFFGLIIAENRALDVRFRVALGDAGGDYILPLPNIYEDGRVCMGSGFEMARAQDEAPLDALNRSVAHLNASSWNADLMTHERMVQLKRMIRFNASFEQQEHTGTLRDNLIAYSAAAACAFTY